jgi:effector-binding domain-containing protein
VAAGKQGTGRDQRPSGFAVGARLPHQQPRRGNEERTCWRHLAELECGRGGEAVRFATVEARPTAVVAQTSTWEEFPELWGRLLGQVYEFVRPRPELATGDGEERWQNVMLYKDQQPDVEVGVLVSGPFQPEGPVMLSALPAGEVATATHRGDYTKLGVTHEAVRDYAAAHGRQLAGPCWEIYGHARPNPSRSETEVFWLLR